GESSTGNIPAVTRSLPCEGEPERMRFARRADSFGRIHQDDSERSPGRRANEAVRDGASQRNQKLEIAELNPQRASSSRDFLCRIWYLCWNLTSMKSAADNPARGAPNFLRAA